MAATPSRPVHCTPGQQSKENGEAGNMSILTDGVESNKFTFQKVLRVVFFFVLFCVPLAGKSKQIHDSSSNCVTPAARSGFLIARPL